MERQAARNNRAIQTPWIVAPGPDTVYTKKQIHKHYRSFDRLDKDSVYGTVFRINKRQAEKFLEGMDRDCMTRFGPIKGSSFALKIIHKKRGLGWGQFSTVVQREANIQAMVHAMHPEITPPVIFAGVHHAHGTGYIAAPWVAGLKSLADKYHQEMYPAIEDMFTKVWSMGILHMDAHLNNIFMTPDSRCILLDWGASAFVPLNVVDDLAARMTNRISRRGRGIDTQRLFEIWKSFVSDHPDVNIESRLYNQVVYRAGAPSLKRKNADWIVLSSLWKYTGKGKNDVGDGRNPMVGGNGKRETRRVNIVTNAKKPPGMQQRQQQQQRQQRDASSIPGQSTISRGRTDERKWQTTARSPRVFRKVVAKGGTTPAFRSFPYPESAWSRTFFETPKQVERRKDRKNATSDDVFSTYTNMSGNTRGGDRGKKTQVGRKRLEKMVSSVTTNPGIRMEKSTRKSGTL
jgi:hypothetical protein